MHITVHLEMFIYLLPLSSVFRKHGISFHCYADDCQIYVPLEKAVTLGTQHFFRCLDDIKAWMVQNSLNCNQKKTEVMVFGDITGSLLADLGPLAQYV